MSHEFFQGVYARTPAWHSLGTVWPGLLTTEEAIRESGIDFGVQKVRIAFEHPGTGIWTPIDDNVGIFAEDRLGDHGIVGIHTPDYETDGFGDHVRALGFNGDAVWESMVLLRKGKIFVGTIRLPDLDVILPDGSHLTSLVSAYSSHDGTYAITYKDTAHRTDCANMLRSLDASGQGRAVRIKHTANKDYERSQAAAVMTYAQQRVDYHSRQCEELLKKKISDKQLDELLQTIWPVPEEAGRGQTIATNKHDTLRTIYRTTPDLQGLRGTAWGVVQAFGDFADHFATYRGTDKADRDRSRNENRLIRTVLKGDTVADKVLALVAS